MTIISAAANFEYPTFLLAASKDEPWQLLPNYHQGTEQLPSFPRRGWGWLDLPDTLPPQQDQNIATFRIDFHALHENNKQKNTIIRIIPPITTRAGSSSPPFQGGVGGGWIFLMLCVQAISKLLISIDQRNQFIPLNRVPFGCLTGAAKSFFLFAFDT